MGRRRKEPNTGFLFVSEAPLKPKDKGVELAIRSHVMRGKNAGPRAARKKSVRQTDTDGNCVRRMQKTLDRSRLPFPGSAHVFTFTKLIEDVGPPAQAKIFDFFSGMMSTFYPLDTCCCVTSADAFKFDWLTIDSAYLHSILYISSLIQDVAARRRPQRDTQYYAIKTIKELQMRLDDASLVLQDSTVTVVVSLASTAQHDNDEGAAEAHIQGLVRLLGLRGGISVLDGRPRLQAKFHRVDLHRSLSSGAPPLFSDSPVVHNPHHPIPEDQSVPSLSGLDCHLQAIFLDLRDMIKALSPGGRHQKAMSAAEFTARTARVQYHLLSVCYSDRLSEIARLAALAFMTTMFTNVPGHRANYPFLKRQISEAVVKAQTAGLTHHSIFAWAIIVALISVLHVQEGGRWRVYASQALRTLGSTWDAVHPRLEEALWIGFIHDASLKTLMNHLSSSA